MKRYRHVAAFALIAFAGLAQSPAGWKMRVDRSTAASDPDAPGDIKFVTSGSGFHATNPQAATYWNPGNTASGTYTLKGTFTQVKQSGHPNYYGIVFGGNGLEGAQQTYTYFVVAQNGMFQIRHREGDSVTNVKGRTPHDAVKKLDDSGKATNALEVRVGADKVDFVVNGTVVDSEPKSAISKTDGIWGVRVNHLLEVQIDGLSKS
jgi:hypothetical protein